MRTLDLGTHTSILSLSGPGGAAVAGHNSLSKAVGHRQLAARNIAAADETAQHVGGDERELAQGQFGGGIELYGDLGVGRIERHRAAAGNFQDRLTPEAPW